MMKKLGLILLMSLFVVPIIIWFPAREDGGDTTNWVNQAPESRRALDFMTDARSYPSRSIPEAGIADGFEYSRKVLRKRTAAAHGKPWRALGPKNVGGRTLAIALNPLNPNTVYAGSASGGLWRSYSGGVGEKAWEYVRTGFPVLGVAAIAIAPNDSNTIYIGTGEVYGSSETFPGVGIRTTRGSYGIGLLKTTDGGQTWFKSLDWLYNQRRGVQKIRIDPVRHNIIWAATTEGTYKSDDAGLSWNQVHDIVMATDIAIHPIDSDVVFVAYGGMGSPGHGIYRTTDGGLSWTKMDLGPEGPVRFEGKALLGMAISNPNIVYASIGGSNGLMPPMVTWLCKTSDGGDSWSVVSTKNYSSLQGWYSHDVAVNPVSPNMVWTAGRSFYPLLSTNGGFNLQSVLDLGLFAPATGVESRDFPHQNKWADYHEIVFHPTNPEIIYFANDGGVFRTTDGGTTSENCNGGYQVTQFYNGTSSSFSDSLFFIGGLQDHGSVAYEGDAFWRLILGSDGNWTAMNQDNNNIVYTSSFGLTIFKDTNRGSNQAIDLPTSTTTRVDPPDKVSPINFISPYILSPVDNLTLYAGSSVVHKSSDGGETWFNTNNGQPLDGNPVLSLAGSFQDVDVVYAATNPRNGRSHVFRTSNGGASWQNITGILPDLFPTDLAVDPHSDVNVYITFGGFGPSHIFKSTDGGANWLDIGDGLPDVPTWAVTVDPAFPGHIYVGNDLGVYVSSDGGLAWQEWMDGLPDAVIAMDLSISPANRAIRVATHGNGVYENKLIGGQLTSVSGDTPITSGFQLHQNYPNPFNAGTTIEYSLNTPAQVTLKIYNVRSQEITTLVNSIEAAGPGSTVWDGTDSFGQTVSTGVYLYRLQAGDFVASRRMIFLK